VLSRSARPECHREFHAYLGCQTTDPLDFVNDRAHSQIRVLGFIITGAVGAALLIKAEE
jgi:hypothetical protein